MQTEFILLWLGILILVSVIASKLSDKFTVPMLLLFLGIGMLAGSDGFGKINFNNESLAQSIGIVALMFIIFSGGFNTNWKDVKPIVWQGFALSTLGVLLTAIITGLFAIYILNFSLLEGLLLGSIVSSTDASAVFNILKSKNISLKQPIKPLLEFESSSNDPMAVFLTIIFINFLKFSNLDLNIFEVILQFILNMTIGASCGYLMAKLTIKFINNLKLDHEGLYPVVMISLVLLTYVFAWFLKANGFLAVYILGLFLSETNFPNKKNIGKFHDGLAWIMQITMFISLGLLVFPSEILPLIKKGILITLPLIFLARPISVFLCLAPFKKMNIREKIMISWVGLKGSAPIILATFPFVAGLPESKLIFNIVFFIVIVSVFIQGTSIPFVSKLLKVEAPHIHKKNYPIEFEKTESIDAELNDLIVPENSTSIGKNIKDLAISDKCLILLISRNDKFTIPSGSTTINKGDVLLVLANTQDFVSLQEQINRLN